MNYMVEKKAVEKNPTYFKKFCEDLVQTGNHVIVITGERKFICQQKLENLNFNSYHEIISIAELALDKYPQSEIEIDYYNNIWIDDSLWGKFYEEICNLFKINIFLSVIDDYFSFIPESVIKLHVEF